MTTSLNILPTAENAPPSTEEFALIRAANRVRGLGSEDGFIRAANSRRNLDDAIAEVGAYEADLRFETLPAAHMRVEDGRVLAGDRELALGGEGFARLCRRLGAPEPYLSRLGPKMRSNLLCYQLRRGDLSASPDGAVRVVSRGDAFLDLQRADLLTLTGRDVVQAVQEGVGEHARSLGVHTLMLDRESLVTEVVGENVSLEVRPNDIIHGGLRLEHSLLGERATTVMAYVLRLVCINGMVHRECVSATSSARSKQRTRRLDSRRQDARELQMDQVRRLAADAWGRLDQKLHAVRKLREDSLGTPERIERVFAQFLRNARMYSESMMNLLRRGWKEEKGGNSELTSFGVLNALTWVATHARSEPDLQQELSDRQAAMLARLAGVFAHQSVHICPSCFRVVAA